MTSVLPIGQRPLYPFPRKSYSRIPDVLEVPNLVRVQTDSFRLLHREIGGDRLLAGNCTLSDLKRTG